MAEKEEKPAEKKTPAKPTILYIIGGNSWDVSHNPDAVRAAFAKHGHDVVVMGEGKGGELSGTKDILLKDIAEEVKKLAKAGKPFTVYFDTHGYMKGDTHMMLMGDQFDRKKLFDDMAKASPDARKFTVTVKREGKAYRLYDKVLGIDTTKPMTFAEAQAAVDKVRGIGPSTRFPNREMDADDFQLPYGGGGIFGGSYRPITIEITPEGSDKSYTIPLDRSTPTKDILRTITDNAKDTPFSIFSTPCYGGGACLSLDESTPPGTVFVSLSNGYEPVYVNDTEELIRAVSDLRKPGFSEMFKAKDLLEAEGGTVTVTLPGETKPALVLEQKDKKPDLKKIQEQLEAEGGTWTITDPGSDKPSRPFKVDKGDKLKDNVFWGRFVMSDFVSKGGTLEVTLTGKKPVKYEFKPLDEKQWDKAFTLLEDKGGVLEVTTPTKKTARVESKPLDMPLNAQNLLMIYLQKSMWGGDGNRNKKVLPAPVVGISGVGILDLEKKLWEVGIIPNEAELRKARALIEKEGGTLTLTLPGGKEPAVKAEGTGAPDYYDYEKLRQTLEKDGGTLTLTVPGQKEPAKKIEVKAGKKIDEWYDITQMLEKDGGALTAVTAKKETLKVEYKKLDPKEWEKARQLLAEKGGVLTVTTPAKDTIKVDYKKPDEKEVEKALALLGKGGTLKVKRPGMEKEAMTIDVMPLDPRTIEDVKKQIKAEQDGKSYGDLKNNMLFGRALAVSLTAAPTLNESVRNIKAYRDFFMALQPEYKGDRVALAKDALARGVKPEKVFERIDGGFFSSYTDHNDAMTMAIRTENAELVGLLTKHGQKLRDDHLRLAIDSGNTEFVGKVLALRGIDTFKEGDRLGSQLLATAVNNKDEAMFRFLEKKGAKLLDSAKTPQLLNGLFDSRFRPQRYEHKKHGSFLKYLVEEKKVAVYSEDDYEGGALYTSAHFGKDAFTYMLDNAAKQTGKKPAELLSKPADRDELLIHKVAAFGSDPEVLDVILKYRKDDLNAGNETPLVKAFTFGNHGMARKLLEMGADINVSSEYKDLGDMALSPVGRRSDAISMVKLLVENNYNIFAQGKGERGGGGTLKQRAAGNRDIVAYLDKKEKEIEANADKLVAALKDKKKEDMLTAVKDSGLKPAELRAVLQFADYEILKEKQTTAGKIYRFTFDLRDLSKDDMVKKLKGSKEYTPEVIKAMLDLEAEEQASKEIRKPEKRFTDDQRDAMKEVLKATPAKERKTRFTKEQRQIVEDVIKATAPMKMGMLQGLEATYASAPLSLPAGLTNTGRTA